MTQSVPWRRCTYPNERKPAGRATHHVLAREVTASQRRPDRRTESVLLKQRLVLDLEFLAVQQRVLRLFNDGADQVEAIRDGNRFLDLRCGPFT